MRKNRIVYLIILVFVILTAGLSNSRAVYAVLYAVLLLPALSISMLLLSGLSWKPAVHISEKIDAASIRKHEEARYTLCVTNSSVFTYIIGVKIKKGVSVTCDGSKQLTYTVSPGKTVAAEIVLRGDRRGVFSSKSVFIELNDFLGLFKLSRKTGGELTLRIFPDILYIPRLPVLAMRSNPNSYVGMGIAEDYAEIADIRKYTPYDTLKKIHWKLTAGKNELMTKHYEKTSAGSVFILFDDGRLPDNGNSLMLGEKMVETLISLILQCTENGCSVNLILTGSGRTISSGDFESLYSAASEIAFDGKNIISHLETTLCGIASQTNPCIIVITHSLSEILCGELAGISHTGGQAVLLNFGDIKSKNAGEILKSSAIPYCNFTYKSDIYETLCGIGTSR